MNTKTWATNIEAERTLWSGITKKHLEESIKDMLMERGFHNVVIKIEEVKE